MTFRTTLIAAALLTASALAAHQGASGVVKERMDAMSSIAAHMKSVSQMLRGRVDYDPATVAQAMREIAAHAEMLPHKFPAGTDAAPSEAAPAIWEKTDKFNEIFNNLAISAAALAAIAEDQTAVSKGFVVVSQTCKSCHADFRIDRE